MFNIYHRVVGKKKIGCEELKTIDRVVYEDCSNIDKFKLFIEFIVPAEYYKETCMSFIRFFSGATRIPHEPIFIIKPINLSRYFITAIYPCVVNWYTLLNIRYQAIQLDKNHEYNIGCPIHYLTYKPLPTFNKEKCWLLDAKGKVYMRNNIGVITTDKYIRQIVDSFPILPDVGPTDSCAKIMEDHFQHQELPEEQMNKVAEEPKRSGKLYPLPILGTSSLSFQDQVNTSLDVIGLETPEMFKLLPHLVLPKEQIEAQRKWFEKKVNEALEVSKEPKNYTKPLRRIQIKRRVIT